jgi:hypothetical protein
MTEEQKDKLTDRIQAIVLKSNQQALKAYGYDKEKLNLEKVYLTEGAALAAALDIVNLLTEKEDKDAIKDILD